MIQKHNRIVSLNLPQMKVLFALWFFVLYLFSSACVAQDIHFSQFNASPLNINPAFTGSFDGDYRFMGNYRSQWSSVTIPYKTISLGADAHNFLQNENVGAGVLINNDKTGDSQLKTFHFMLSGSYKKSLDEDLKHQLIGGLQLGIAQKHIDYDDLQFDSQYDGYLFNSAASNNESFKNEGQLYPIINLGALWQYQNERTKANFGLSLYNVNSPKQSFFNKAQIKLDRRLNIHGGGQVPLSKKVELLPSLLYMKQGSFSEFMIGTFGKLILTNDAYHYQAIYLGTWLRTGDAGCLVAAMDYDNINVGFSYDLNYSDLREASSRKGGFEISFRYIIKDKPIGRVKYTICPDYI
ncbi:MAG TPA: type IX secretion system membrane protein PorP/SprF [Flavobacteriales bacterium]|nr:type IX secretion system membrane protein PorP/SprF [Flavobacteriales bacterium]HIN39164.1 type IX secretion system membrane protein PorP/SprF [Flavobacteriales bacterium]